MENILKRRHSIPADEREEYRKNNVEYLNEIKTKFDEKFTS
jgi:hypothetical protein